MVKTQITSSAQYPKLSGKPNSSFVLISLTDSGPGVPTALRTKIFLAGESGTGGTGLGLYFAQMIAEEHGGAIWLENTGSEGSTFIFALPMHEFPGE